MPCGRRAGQGQWGPGDPVGQPAHAEPTMPLESVQGKWIRCHPRQGLLASRAWGLSSIALIPRKELRFARQIRDNQRRKCATLYFTEQETEAQSGDGPALGVTARPCPSVLQKPTRLALGAQGSRGRRACSRCCMDATRPRSTSAPCPHFTARETER